MRNLLAPVLNNVPTNLMLGGLVTTGAIALSTVTLPALANPVDIDYSGNVEATVDVEDEFAAWVNGFTGIALPDGDISDVVTGTLTLDDDPNQYSDGDISLGYDFLSSVLGLEIDSTTFAMLDSWLDLEFTGGGTLSNGSSTMTYSLSYDNLTNELIATFDNFDLNTEIISSCVTIECTWAGDFFFTSLGEEILGEGTFNLTTNPGIDGSESVPEPASLLGMGVVFGIGLLTKKKRQ